MEQTCERECPSQIAANGSAEEMEDASVNIAGMIDVTRIGIARKGKDLGIAITKGGTTNREIGKGEARDQRDRDRRG
jgi:hypothetical protein